MYILAQKLNEKHSKSLDTTASHPVVFSSGWKMQCKVSHIQKTV